MRDELATLALPFVFYPHCKNQKTSEQTNIGRVLKQGAIEPPYSKGPQSTTEHLTTHRSKIPTRKPERSAVWNPTRNPVVSRRALP